MAAELKKNLQPEQEVQISVVPSTGGVFEVEDDGVLIFSKKQLGRFPQEGEIMGIITSSAPGSLPNLP